jgi:hypothetical protein
MQDVVNYSVTPDSLLKYLPAIGHLCSPVLYGATIANQQSDISNPECITSGLPGA